MIFWVYAQKDSPKDVHKRRPQIYIILKHLLLEFKLSALCWNEIWFEAKTKGMLEAGQIGQWKAPKTGHIKDKACKVQLWSCPVWPSSNKTKDFGKFYAEIDALWSVCRAGHKKLRNLRQSIEQHNELWHNYGHQAHISASSTDHKIATQIGVKPFQVTSHEKWWCFISYQSDHTCLARGMQP